MKLSRYQARHFGKQLWLGLLILAIPTLVLAQGTVAYDYAVDLKKIVNDRYQVRLECSQFARDTLIYHFPWIIPGTYMEANYGKFIHELKVFDEAGQTLHFTRKGKNTYVIAPATHIQTIQYWVSASWETPRLRTIWPMAGTGILPGRVFAINAGGVFGYFEGFEKTAVAMQFEYPEALYAMTVLDQTPGGPGVTSIAARDYNELIDSPILFAYPDTAFFKIKNMDVLVGYSHETDDTRRALELSEALQPSMTAIAGYLDSLPGEDYAFLIHYKDDSELGAIMDNPRFILFKAIAYVVRNGIPLGGALEHNRSSFYFLPDPGKEYTDGVKETVESISVHEFMHILTPLNLHSQFIDDWDYNAPEMSKHLWLYEGVTEYLSEIIKVNGGLITPKEFLLGSMGSKIRSGEKFPFHKMSFTEMSSNVLERPYKRQFSQVYQRGAVIGMLLDIEIIRLTEGRKRLIDVMLELAQDYGPEKPMDEEAIFDVFTQKVHPELRDFFTRYVEGKEALPYTEVLAQVGVEYLAEARLDLPRDPIKDNDVKISKMGISKKTSIKKVGRKERIGLKQGDKYGHRLYRDNYLDDYGDPWPEGLVIEIPIERDGAEISLPDTIRYYEQDVKHRLRIMKDMTARQALYFDIWLGFRPPVGLGDAEALEEK